MHLAHFFQVDDLWYYAPSTYIAQCHETTTEARVVRYLKLQGFPSKQAAVKDAKLKGYTHSTLVIPISAEETDGT